jgi:hypothetical protein
MNDEQLQQPPRFTGFGGKWDKAATYLGAALSWATLPIMVPLVALLKTPIWAWCLLAIIYFMH